MARCFYPRGQVKGPTLHEVYYKALYFAVLPALYMVLYSFLEQMTTGTHGQVIRHMLDRAG